MDKTGWITHCFGRFLIDLPPTANIKTSYVFWHDSIDRLTDTTPSSLPAHLDTLEGKLKAQVHDKGGNMFIRRVDLGGGSTGLLSWYSEASRGMQILDTFVITKTNPQVFHWPAEMTTDREQRGIEIARSLARNIRSREPNEIPSEPGFCIDHGLIAGSERQRESFSVGVTFPDHPGAMLDFRSSTGAAEKTLLERMGGFTKNVLTAVAGINVLRKGRHDVGPLPAEEYLAAGSDKGQRGYSFAWDVKGKDDSLSEPHMAVGLGVLERDPDSKGNPPPPAFRSDKEALDLWDTIIDSIRLRPGAVGTPTMSSVAPSGPDASGIASSGARSGTPCPWPGEWTCNEAP
ncbi:T6SS immunity protein Tli4 family protein [Dyella sedimenti]|uniref:T6SS immunity protein Tli4 family protein n=1 Tax=Dyella sedimenti TaxID=2919947 RepID=UPI001FAB2C13|nr:T6SS immunity protein Tli4 family protein [Dyella sedimenti]